MTRTVPVRIVSKTTEHGGHPSFSTWCFFSNYDSHKKQGTDRAKLARIGRSTSFSGEVSFFYVSLFPHKMRWCCFPHFLLQCGVVVSSWVVLRSLSSLFLAVFLLVLSHPPLVWCCFLLSPPCKSTKYNVQKYKVQGEGKGKTRKRK